jgi:hypothetical protein
MISYNDVTDVFGRFDRSRFDAWVLKVVTDAMTVPYGSVWVSS